MIVLTMTNATKVYRTDTIETTALRNVSFNLNEGEFVSLTGNSGSGKSTLLNVLGLLEYLDAGSLELFGRDVSELTERSRAKLRRDKIGFIFQSFNLISDLTIQQNIEMPLYYQGVTKTERHNRGDKLLRDFGLFARRSHFPSQLSGGQQQRVAIARALSGRPSVILADEPTGNLDSEMSREIMSILSDLPKHGVGLLVVTHDMEIAKMSNREIRIADGQIIN